MRIKTRAIFYTQACLFRSNNLQYGQVNNTSTLVQECFRQAEEEVVSNSRNELRQTRYKYYFPAPCIIKWMASCQLRYYRDRLKSMHQIWWSLLLLLLTPSASTCLQHSRNLVLRLQPISVQRSAKKAWLFAKLQPGRARMRINAI